MEKRKESAQQDFMEMIQKSWTWERLTEKEKQNFIKGFYKDNTKKCIKGSYAQRWETMQTLYTIYLLALNYEPIGWRE